MKLYNEIKLLCCMVYELMGCRHGSGLVLGWFGPPCVCAALVSLPVFALTQSSWITGVGCAAARFVGYAIDAKKPPLISERGLVGGRLGLGYLSSERLGFLAHLLTVHARREAWRSACLINLHKHGAQFVPCLAFQVVSIHQLIRRFLN